MYHTTNKLLEILQWNHNNQIYILEIGGATSIIDCHHVVMTCLGHDIIALVNIHCIAHCLFVGDGLKIISNLSILNQFANNYYDWIGRNKN